MSPRTPVTALACALLLAACGGHAAGGQQPGKDPQASAGAPVGEPSATPGAGIPAGDWSGFNFDAQRSGVGPSDTGITSRNVGRLKRRQVRIDGTADSSAIELHAVSAHGRSRDVFVVTTTYGRTIALDAGTGQKLWEFVPSNIHAYEGSAQITTATPVADPNRRYVYAPSPDGRIHKLAISTGHQVRSHHWPVSVTRDASHEKIASALNISGQSVVVVTGGYIGDAPQYQGHVVLINRTDGRITAVWNSLCSNRHHLLVPRTCPASDSAIWGRAGAVIEPGSARILLATGNAPFNGLTNWGDSVLELSATARHLLHHWTPSSQGRLNANDTDVGSTAPALLPSLGGRHLVVQSGKDGLVHLLNLDRLNGTRGRAGRRLGGELQSLPAPGGSPVFSAPAVWGYNGHALVFVADDAGTAAYQISPGKARLSVVWRNGTSGTSPIIAGGLLYVYDMNAGRLNIRQPTTGHLLASLPAGSGHWNSPIAIGGRIALPVGNGNDHVKSGRVNIYHLPGR